MMSVREKHRKLVLHLMAFTFFLCGQINSIYADNLGVEGSVYQIVEPDMLTGIHEKLEMMKTNGELERQKQAVIRRTIQHILRPRPVSGVSDLPKGKKPVVRYFNPTIILNKNIKNANNDIIARKGTRVNPLDSIRFNETLIFINGDNARQIHWANQLIKRDTQKQKPFKIILVNGDINATAKALHHQIYFDQHGTLCHHFKIKHTPTLVFQPTQNKDESKKLLVQEVQID